MLFLLLFVAFVVWCMYRSAKFCLCAVLFYVFVLGSPGCHRRRFEAMEGPPAIKAAILPEARDDPREVMIESEYGPLAHERGW